MIFRTTLIDLYASGDSILQMRHGMEHQEWLLPKRRLLFPPEYDRSEYCIISALKHVNLPEPVAVTPSVRKSEAYEISSRYRTFLGEYWL
jgi:hypothetical protein